MAPDSETPSLSPIAQYHHDHPPVTNVNEVMDAKLTTGQRLADGVASIVGSWPFIACQSVLLALWITMNVYLALHPAALRAFDPYPFILLNLLLSFQAAYTGPIVMMSQNRQSEKDRLMAQSDYQCNVTAENEIRLMMDHLRYQDELMREVLARLDAIARKPSQS